MLGSIKVRDGKNAAGWILNKLPGTKVVIKNVTTLQTSIAGSNLQNRLVKNSRKLSHLKRVSVMTKPETTKNKVTP